MRWQRSHDRLTKQHKRYDVKKIPMPSLVDRLPVTDAPFRVVGHHLRKEATVGLIMRIGRGGLFNSLVIPATKNLVSEFLVFLLNECDPSDS